MRLSLILILMLLVLNVVLITLSPLHTYSSHVGKRYIYDFNLTMQLKMGGNVSSEKIILNYTLILTDIAEYNGKYFLVDIIDKNDTTRYLKVNFYQGKDGLISGFHVIESHKLKWPAETLWHLMLMLSLFKFSKGIRVNIFDVFYNRFNETHGQLWNVSLTCSSIDIKERIKEGNWNKLTYSVENLFLEVSVSKMVKYTISRSTYRYSSICDGNLTVIYQDNNIVPYNATGSFDTALFIGAAPAMHVLMDSKLTLVKMDNLVFPSSLHPNTSYGR